LLSGWRRKYPLYDPFCGSGTILIEAAMFAWDMAPCVGRRFAISKLSIADEKIENRVRAELRARIDFTHRIRIAGSDGDAQSINAARANLRRVQEIAGGKMAYAQTQFAPHDAPNDGHSPRINSVPQKTVTVKVAPKPAGEHCPHLPEIRLLPARDIRAPYGDAGFVVTNPPYGRRLGSEAEAEETYGEMGHLSRNIFRHWTFAVITDHPGFESYFGQKSDSARSITNGNIPCFLYIFDNSLEDTCNE
jgi:putative N6-adenine-specific DNA methylase